MRSHPGFPPWDGQISHHHEEPAQNGQRDHGNHPGADGGEIGVLTERGHPRDQPAVKKQGQRVHGTWGYAVSLLTRGSREII